VDAKTANGTPCTDDGNVCTTDLCNGSSALCQHAAGNAGSVCHDVAGPCDVAETCDGSSAACPPDALADTSVVCASPACSADGSAIVSANCDGLVPSCPTPVPAPCPAGTMCDPTTLTCL
jgi:hypothetical protein